MILILLVSSRKYFLDVSNILFLIVAWVIEVWIQLNFYQNCWNVMIFFVFVRVMAAHCGSDTNQQQVCSLYVHCSTGHEPWKSYFAWIAWLKFGISDGLRKLKLHTVYAVISEAIKPLQLVGPAAEFKFESKFEPMQVIWRSSEGSSRR